MVWVFRDVVGIRDSMESCGLHLVGWIQLQNVVFLLTMGTELLDVICIKGFMS